MKHIKLFENWAEENAKLPEWLDPNTFKIDGMCTLYDESVQQHLIIAEDSGELVLAHPSLVDPKRKLYDDLRCNFKSFSDYDFWLPEYRKLITVNQNYCKYKLEDCFGIPETNELRMLDTNVKTLKGLEKRKFDKLSVNSAKIENFKYCPNSKVFKYRNNPLLSYYRIKSQNIENFKLTLCGDYTYNGEDYYNDNIPSLEQLNDPEFNANIFCYFPFEVTNSKYSNGIQFNPWNQIHDDPNETENYDFLFMPFYLNSENFRTKAKEYIKNLDITNLDRSDLW